MVSFKDVYTKEELIANNWNFSYYTVETKRYVDSDIKISMFGKLSVYDKETAMSIAKTEILEYLNDNPEIDIDSISADLHIGNSISSTLYSINLK